MKRRNVNKPKKTFFFLDKGLSDAPPIKYSLKNLKTQFGQKRNIINTYTVNPTREKF